MTPTNTSTQGSLLSWPHSRKLSVFERNILRKIHVYVPTKEVKGIWRIKTNKELDELMKTPEHDKLC
jgi:hypothetical protein